MRQLATDSLFGIQSAYGFRVSLKKLPDVQRACGQILPRFTPAAVQFLSFLLVFFASAPEWICNGEIDDATEWDCVSLTHLS